MEHQWEVMRFGRKKKKACGSSDFGLDINLRGLLQLSGRAPQTGGLRFSNKLYGHGIDRIKKKSFTPSVTHLI